MKRTPTKPAETVLTCSYNVQALPGDEPHMCGKRATKKVDTINLHMLYCEKHFQAASGRLKEMHIEAEDIGV